MYKSLFLLLLFLSYGVDGRTQDSSLQDGSTIWHLQDCIAYAKKNNISLATAKLVIQTAKEDWLLTQAAILPNLNGNVSQGIFNSTNQNTTNAQSSGHLSGNYGLNSSIVIYNGNYLRKDIVSKDYAYQSANLSLKESENDLSLLITQAFFNLLMAQETMILLDTVLVNSKIQYQMGKGRFDAGSISRKEFLLFDAQVASDQFNLVNAGNAVKLNTIILKQLLLLPTSYFFVITNSTETSFFQWQFPLLETQEIARQNRPEVSNRILLVKKAEIEIDKARANQKPIINAGASLSSSYSNSASDNLYLQIGNNFYQSISITMGIPIYSRRINKTNINKSIIQKRQSELDLLNTRVVLDQLIEQAFVNSLNANAQLNAATIQYNTNQEIYNISNQQLAMGGLNSIDLLLQKNLYIQSLQLFTQSKYSALMFAKIYSFYRGVALVY